MQEFTTSTSNQLRLAIKKVIRDKVSRQLQTQINPNSTPSNGKRERKILKISRENFFALLQDSIKILNLLNPIMISFCNEGGMHQAYTEQSVYALLLIFFFNFVSSFAEFASFGKQKKCPDKRGIQTKYYN